MPSRNIFSKNTSSIPVLVLPPHMSEELLEQYQKVAARKGLILRAPKTADARLAMAWLTHRTADELRQQIPDGLSFHFNPEALSLASVEPGKENQFSQFMLAALTNRRLQSAA